MGLTLNILSSGAQPGRETVFPMAGEALTIGRSESNDIVLPDPTREISSSHAVLQHRNGDYVIVDTSTNGTFLNGDSTPLGDLPTPLNHGDVLRIGAYEMQVTIAAATASADPFADLPPPVGEEAIVEDTGGTAMEDIAGIDTSGGDFLDDLLGSAPPNAARMETRSAVDADDSIIDDFLDVEQDPNRQGGASAPNHSAPTQDFFNSNEQTGGIPDDWDDAFVSGKEAPPAGGGGGLIPETSFSSEPFEIPKPEANAPAPAPEPAALEQPPGPDPIEALLDSRAETTPSGEDLPPAPEDLEPIAEETAPEPEPTPEPEPVAETPEPEPEPTPAPEKTPVATAPSDATGQDLARRFLEAAGVNQDSIKDEELGEVMDRAGLAYRKLIEGAREVLMARASIKDELRLGQTMVSADGNNPIKFSVSPEQAMEAMIKPTVAGYKPGDKAAAEAMRDIKAHEVAMMTGMETAIKALLARFNPDALGATIEESGALGSLLRNKKAQYWDAFEKLYAKISEDAEEDFNALFGKSFASAYKDQMAKLKAEEDE